MRSETGATGAAGAAFAICSRRRVSAVRFCSADYAVVLPAPGAGLKALQSEMNGTQSEASSIVCQACLEIDIVNKIANGTQLVNPKCPPQMTPKHMPSSLGLLA